MKRRQFIILSGIGAASTTLLSACGHPENKLIPALIPDDEYVPGIDYWKASTCDLCPAGCGIAVRTREHKANKIEGNPLHPVNQGTLCARGQAGLQVLYHPDRVRSPMKRTGPRGSGQFAEITWDEAIGLLSERLSQIKSQGRIGSAVFATSDESGATAIAAETLFSGYGPIVFAHVGASETVATKSYLESYGTAGVPLFDIANASLVLSFGARFLETWHSPLHYSLAYSRFRGSGPSGRGKLVQVEPRMSVTAANADQWLPVAPGTEGLLALAIAQVITHEGLVANPPPPQFLKEPLDSFTPEAVAGLTGIPGEKIVAVARQFAAARAPLAIGGGLAAASDRGPANMLAINFLNLLVGNLNKPGGVLPSKAEYDPFSKWRGTSARHVWLSFSEALSGLLAGKAPSAVLLHDVNPVYSDPRLIGQLQQAEYIACFSTIIDETAAMADLILPDHSYLESWNIQRIAAFIGAGVSVTRPVVTPEYNTMQAADVLIKLGPALGVSMPFESAQDIVKKSSSEMAKQKGSIDAAGSDDFWNALTARGVWIATEQQKRETKPGPLSNPVVFEGSTEQGGYPFTLLAYEHPALGFGDSAHLPWLQELPDALTTVQWGSWIEINPVTAARLGISDGDMVEVQSAHGSVKAPAVVFPAIHPNAIGIAFGQGHTASGRYAAGRGVNAAELDPITIAGSGDPRTVQVSIRKSTTTGRLVRFGSSIAERPEVPR